MAKSNEYIEGFKAALFHYSWMDNFKIIKVGLPGIPISVAIKQIENEREPQAIEKKAEKETETDE